MKKQLLASIEHRFSPMIFSDREVSDEDMQLLFQAARWASSSYNKQPWLFLWSRKGSKGFEQLFSFLSEYNQAWVRTAPVLMLSLAQWRDEKDEENYYALYDLGQAVSAMAIQASSMGIQLHQMAGFDHVKAREELKIPASYHIGSMIALGYPGDVNQLSGHFYERATQQRERKPLDMIAVAPDYFQK